MGRMPVLNMRNGRCIDESSAPYITAEINTGHFGKMDLAFEAIKAARNAGCDCIKFQSWKPESLFTTRYLTANRIEHRMYDRLSLDASQLSELSNECARAGIDFCSTPYSFAEIDELASIGSVPYLKIASMEIDNPEFLAYAGRSGVPIVLSTGMADMHEIRSAVSTILDTGNTNLALLHCTSVYPTPDNDLNLLNISTLRSEFPEVLVGFSDHSLGIIAPVVAVGLGARFLEKHFTLDRSKPGFDNAMALMPDQLAEYVRVSHSAASMLGTPERVLSEAELDQRKIMRRSVFAAEGLTAGTLLTREMLQFKRPGSGVSPSDSAIIVGRTLTHDVEEGQAIGPEDVTAV